MIYIIPETFLKLYGLMYSMDLSPSAEKDLVRRAQQGDAQAFGELVLAHQTFVYNLALRALSDALEAQDAAQEAFLRAWQALPGFRGQAGFRTWLYRIVVNLCYNRSPELRRRMSQLSVEDEAEAWPEMDLPGPERYLEARQQQAFLHEQIERLPENYRVLVMLRYQQDLSYEEIAQVLNMPLGSVKTGLFRAHARLKTALQAAQEALYVEYR
jgi:RNA polymerase sigma-70 factor (ECF subfamily)